MTPKDRNDSRREFLSRIGMDAAALLLPVAAPQLLKGQTCAPPGNTSNPTAWGSDCRALQPRRPASTLTSSEVSKLRAAYQAMRALDTTDPSDPRGFLQQAHIHCYMCNQAPPAELVHYTLNFLPWHRAYLYFHERILGKLVGDMTLRLPYWDWENPAHNKLPPPYTSPNNSGNPLWNGTRVMSPSDTLPAGDTNLTAALTASSFSLFSSTLENGPHGSVHVDVGGDMGAFETAALDPVFYAHHSNVDKCWVDWVKADPGHTNPTTSTWLNKSYGFYDENKVWRTIKNSQVTDNEGGLRYYYGTRAFEFISLACIIRWRDIVVAANPNLGEFTIPATALETLRGAMNTAVVQMILTGPQLPRDHSAVYSIYLSEREADEDKGTDSPGYVGSIPVVVGSKEHQHQLPPAVSVAMDVTPRMKFLIERKGQNQLFAVQRTPKPDKKAVLKVPFRGVSYRVGDLAKV